MRRASRGPIAALWAVISGGLRGVVSRKAYLGETVDYRVMIGDAEIRVQKGRRVPGPAVGDSVGLAFPQPHWYPIE